MTCKYYYCPCISDIYLYASFPPIIEKGKDIISDYNSVTLHVPADSLDVYKNTSPWNKFGKIVTL